MEYARLGDYIKEYSKRNKADEDIPVYSVTNTKGFCKDYFEKEVASKDKTTYKIVPQGFFAYNPSRINVGSVDWQRNEKEVIVSSLYNVFSVSPKLLQQYLYYYLKSDFALQRIKAVATGSVRDNLKLEMLYEFPIKLRSMEEQKTVVQKLDIARNVIDLRRKELIEFDNLIKARFVEMFGDPISNYKQYRKEQVGKHIDLLSGYPFKSEGYVDEGINICGGLIIMPQRIKWEECMHWKSTEGFENYVLKEDDIVMALDRPWISEGLKIAKVDAMHLPALLIQRTARIRAIDMNQDYLYYSFINGGFDRHSNVTGSLVPHISAKDIKSFEVMIPPIELQNQFADFVTQVDKSKLLLLNAFSPNHFPLLQNHILDSVFAI